MVIYGEQEGLLFVGGPPLVEGGIVLPEFINAGAFPAPPGFGARFGLTDEMGKMGSGESGDRFAMALKAEAGFQFVGDQLKVGRFLEWDEILEEGDDVLRPVRPMVAAGELGDQVRAFSEEAGAQPVKMSAADLEVVGGISGINGPRIELAEDLLEEQGGDPFCDLRFL